MSESDITRSDAGIQSLANKRFMRRSTAVQRFMRFRPVVGAYPAGDITVGGRNGSRVHDRVVALRRRAPSVPPPTAPGLNGAAPHSDGSGMPPSVERVASEPPRPSSRRGRLAGVGMVTIIEAGSIFAWLWLHQEGHPWWGLLVLVLGEMVETAFLQKFVDRGGLKRWGTLPRQPKGATSHMAKVQRILGIAGNVEIAIWLLWLACAEAFNQPVAAAALLVAMHLKHQSEMAAVRDLPFRKGFFSPVGLVGTFAEVAGAVACLALVLDGQYVWAAAVIGVGLLVEHWLLIDVVMWEITTRDIRVPRDPRWRPPARSRASTSYLTSHFPRLWAFVQSITWLERLGNRLAINALIGRIEPRPNPFTTMATYTSWASLTDKSFNSRHLPAAGSDWPKGTLAPSAEVARLFAREGDMTECPKTTVLFSFFAQWFTDGILRTQRDGTTKDGKPKKRDTLKNESTHEVDLAQLYGLDRDATDQLRVGRGLLKSQMINGEEYPPFYYHAPAGPGTELKPNPEFSELPAPLVLGRPSYEQQRTLFAMGTDTRNIGFISFNVLFLREHNRIARQLGDEYPSWDDDQVFETTRNILIVVLLKIVVEEYINHINPTYFQFRLLPGSFPNEPWHRPNWIAVEFNLLYRWHALVPSTFHLGGKALDIVELVSNTGVLTDAGLAQLMAAASNQAAGRMSLFNTDGFLVDMAEKPSIDQGRLAKLASYNDYRRLCRHTPVTTFAEISSDPRVQQRLAELYPGGVDDVEFYVGLFAEDVEANDVLPPLMMTMVAFDAFSQALTNPLLGPKVFNEATFSAVGMDIITKTKSISDLVHRNVPRECDERFFVSLTRRDYERG